MESSLFSVIQVFELLNFIFIQMLLLKVMKIVIPNHFFHFPIEA